MFAMSNSKREKNSHNFSSLFWTKKSLKFQKWNEAKMKQKLFLDKNIQFFPVTSLKFYSSFAFILFSHLFFVSYFFKEKSNVFSSSPHYFSIVFFCCSVDICFSFFFLLWNFIVFFCRRCSYFTFLMMFAMIRMIKIMTWSDVNVWKNNKKTREKNSNEYWKTIDSCLPAFFLFNFCFVFFPVLISIQISISVWHSLYLSIHIFQIQKLFVVVLRKKNNNNNEKSDVVILFVPPILLENQWINILFNEEKF